MQTPQEAEQKQADKGKQAEQVVRWMNLVIETVSPSPISSHVKGDVITLLERLRDEEALRILGAKK